MEEHDERNAQSSARTDDGSSLRLEAPFHSKTFVSATAIPPRYGRWSRSTPAASRNGLAKGVDRGVLSPLSTIWVDKTEILDCRGYRRAVSRQEGNAWMNSFAHHRLLQNRLTRRQTLLGLAAAGAAPALAAFAPRRRPRWLRTRSR